MLLELLNPAELPIKYPLNPPTQIKLKKILTELLTALTETDIEQAINTIETAIAEIEIYDVFPLETISTKTTLKYWEIEDFDTYFHVQHVQSHEPELCLVKGLLSACQIFLYLKQDNLNLDITQIELQKEGFKSYVHLLDRVFELNLESC
jgi:hypothetical protein